MSVLKFKHPESESRRTTCSRGGCRPGGFAPSHKHRSGGLYASYPGGSNRIAGNGVLILGLPLLIAVAMVATAGLAIAIPLTVTGFLAKGIAACRRKEELRWS